MKFKNDNRKQMACSICGGPIDVKGDWDQGHNAAPVNAGRCCSECNATVVIPRRLRDLGYFKERA